ncbi:DUF6088 family protein [Croceimicrobium hydrocarbonivorans]|uniref:AbiEi antitoxin C-terminal domain-containing protein n=1 Tax=Croceimicrobium hydrocarbonivorans TaxID=2761580 RepID=A0A7H0VD55_9FLAO|nr:DUF6088 family protein [Croceimicrobium hydrocarbonivorans]QNR23653.1 hypothetical protein H4K34_14915 [Croceimicrobium hydrocarbonivorans]
MKVTEYVKYKINNLPKGYVFTYEDFLAEANKQEAVIKALNRLVDSGKISKLSKGKFYKPEQSPFGELLPDEYQIVKDFLEKDGKLIGYITGPTIYNRLGLTTQISTLIQIGCGNVRPATTRGKYTISFVRQKNNISKDNIPLLQILDAIKNIKKIPDTAIDTSCRRLMAIISELSSENINTILRLAQKYPPSTRALLGAIIDQVKPEVGTTALSDSLNPISSYKIGISNNVLANSSKWNIV